MIPTIIHYCWFGTNKKPRLANECIESWRKMNPDFTIMEWNESNSPINDYPFAKEALKEKKYAFVSDIIRLWALKTYGGIYLDTDVEIIKPLNELLHTNNITGYEKDTNMLQTAFMGAEKNDKWINDCLSLYESLHFSSNQSEMRNLVNNILLSKMLEKKGVLLNGEYFTSNYVTIYPHDYFCPMSYGTHFIEKTENTYCIHYYSFSWSKPETLKGYIRVFIINLIGEKVFRNSVNIIRKVLSTK